MINVTRRETAPESLAFQKSYRTPDVIQALFEDFYQKCYLTEFRFSDSRLMEIDHFVTQTEDASRIYDWKNLFPIHDKVNKKRPKTTPTGGYLNPCDSEDDAEMILNTKFTLVEMYPSGLKTLLTSKQPTRRHC